MHRSFSGLLNSHSTNRDWRGEGIANMGIRILLVDDHRILRKGLQALLEREEDFEVVAEASSGREAVKLAKTKRPHVVIMDVGMPDLNGFEATRQIMVETRNVKVLALSMHSDSRFVRKMLQGGASGYLLKDVAFEELADAIRTVVANRIYLGSGISDVVVKDYLQHLPAQGSTKEGILTLREREVLQLLAEGKSTKEIGQLLYVSVKTVETHRKRIMDKLDLHTIAELTKYALREGLTVLES